MLEWPARLPGLDWLPAKYHGRKFRKIPWLVVIHSGSFSDNVAEYLHAPPDGRKVSTHFSWSRKKGYFVQQVDLDTVAWHVGGSRFRGQGRLNWCSIGIELPGPWRQSPRPMVQRDLLRSLLGNLKDAMPCLDTLTAHQFIDENKRDPGPGVDASWFEGLGFEVVWEKCR
jgi:N-acetyl-anhydromuramyl-L-alanine amidase AmpD